LIINSDVLLAQYTWTRYPDNPIMSGSGNGTWDKHVFIPTVLFNADSNRYEMFYCGSYGPEVSWRPYRIGYAWSVDGINWTKYSGNPVLVPDIGTWDESSVELGGVIRENGQYKMWYYGLNNTTRQIGYATSPDGINWTKYSGNPVLSAGTASWEAGGVLWCGVIKESSGYTMYYTGTDITATYFRIGRATSVDGINWQRDIINNPIISVGLANQWDDRAACAPQCIYVNNMYYIVYTGWAQNLYGNKIGLATSPDGINWTKYANNPALNLGASGSWDGNYVEAGTIMLVQDKFWMWYDGSKDDTGVNLLRIGLATAPVTSPLFTGTYAVGNGGDFATIQQAFNKLSTDGINGPITLELTNNNYIAPADSFGFKLEGPIAGTGPNNRITIKPAAGKNVNIMGSGMNILHFLNMNYLVLDGVDITGSTTLTIHSLQGQYPWKVGLGVYNNSDYNIIKNVTFIHDDFDSETYGLLVWTKSGTATADNNQIMNNFVKSSGVGICVAGIDQSRKASNNIIQGNKVGSETDSLVTWGIYAAWLQNSIIQDNIVQNMRFNVDYQFNQSVVGINASVCDGTSIRNNVVYNIKSSGNRGSAGILVSGDTGGFSGSNNKVYNNMVYDIQSTSTHFSGRIGGIQLWNQINPKIYYNSVYLSGVGDNVNPLGSAALYIFNNVTNADVMNNILVNTRDESPYCATSLYSYSLNNFSSDYNDLFYLPGQHSCLIRAGGYDYHTLPDWQVTQKDLHSYDEMPNFIEPFLHIDSSVATYLEGRAKPITGISTDYDWQSRRPLTPDIGADEFDGIPIVGVEDEETLPTEFALEQNYPNPFNPSTTFRYSVPTQSKVVIKVYDILGNEVATLMDEEKSVGTYELTWNADNLSSGIYFYQLKAGEFVSTKKMILLK
jgi:predicted GH43/DUF377 family glycosyl hydrolase